MPKKKPTINMKKTYAPLIIFFIIINALAIVFKVKLAQYKIDNEVIIIGNLLIALLSTICLGMHAKALRNNNPNAFVRSVMAGSLIKLLVIGLAAISYLFIVKRAGVYSVLFCVVLYFAYTVIEVKAAMRMNKQVK